MPHWKSIITVSEVLLSIGFYFLVAGLVVAFVAIVFKFFQT